MLSEFLQVNWTLFIHIAGIIVGLGAVTVIDFMGFISRKDKGWTQTTIQAHHVTKPLIWVGTILVVLSWGFMLFQERFTDFNFIKSIILIVLIINGSFLSFYISPRLDKLSGKNVLLPKDLQSKIALSMMVSFIGWWSFVVLTVAGLS